MGDRQQNAPGGGTHYCPALVFERRFKQFNAAARSDNARMCMQRGNGNGTENVDADPCQHHVWSW
jgi:hypothetical protein